MATAILTTKTTLRGIAKEELDKLTKAQIGAIDPEAYRKGYATLLNSLMSATATVAQPKQQEQATGVLAIPQVGEVFELALEGDADGLAMVTAFGYNAEGWTYDGKGVAQPRTRKFKLVSVGYCANWNELIRKIGAEGKIPEGQWMAAFKAKYPRADWKGSIGIADDKWLDPGRDRRFPYVNSNGKSWYPDFGWTGYGFGGSWRWVVVVSD